MLYNIFLSIFGNGNITRAFASSCISFKSCVTFAGSMFFKCNKASRSPMVMHANILANFIVPFAVTPLPTMYVWYSLPGRSIEFSFCAIASALKKVHKTKLNFVLNKMTEIN